MSSVIPVCLQWENSLGLVTLWEIMKPFQPLLSTELIVLLELLNSKSSLPTSIFAISGNKVGHEGERIAERRIGFREILLLSERQCIELGLTASLFTVRRMIEVLNRHDCEFRELYLLADELRGRVVDEMKGRHFFSLDLSQAEQYSNPVKGWTEVLERFPAATTDVEEMNKCFALSRYAAAVFHSVQAIECGLLGLGVFINVKDPKSGWTAVTGALSTLVTKTKYPDLDPLYQKHFNFLEQMHGIVGALNNAWRNKISHAQGRLVLMTSEFSPEVAEEIMVATRSFMRRLATELPTATETKTQ